MTSPSKTLYLNLTCPIKTRFVIVFAKKEEVCMSIYFAATFFNLSKHVEDFVNLNRPPQLVCQLQGNARSLKDIVLVYLGILNIQLDEDTCH